RHNDKRHPVTGVNEVASRPRCLRANISRKQIYRLDTVRTNRRLGSNMVVETSILIVGQNKCRILPRTACHQPIDELGDVMSPVLEMIRPALIIRWMLIITGIGCSLNLSNLRQSSVLQVVGVIRAFKADGSDVV